MALVPPRPSESVLKPVGEYEPERTFNNDQYDNQSGREKGEIRLVTGSGDEDVKLWSLSHRSDSPSPPTPRLIHTFTPPPPSDANAKCSSIACGGAVLSVMVKNGCIYAGFQDGVVVVWDLSTKVVVRAIVTKKVSFSDLKIATALWQGADWVLYRMRTFYHLV